MAATIPSYLQGNPAMTAQSYLQHLPGLFNTSGLQKAYGAQMQSTFDQGRALAAAAANQYTQRAQQNGASSLGAGFAQASAMIPVYQQNFGAQGDLQKLLLQNRTQQAQIGAGLAGNIGQLQSGYQNSLSDYFLNQQKLKQQQGQFDSTMGQNAFQYSQDYGLKQQQLALQALQLQGKNGGGLGGGGGYSPLDRSGYVPNSGPLQDAYVNGQRQFNTVSGGGGATNGANFYTSNATRGMSASDYNRAADLRQINQNNQNLW